MSGEDWLRLDIGKRCNGACGCKRKPNFGIDVREEHDKPEKGYLKRVHTATSDTFTLRSVRYNNEWVVGGGLENVSEVTEIAVYYGGQNLDIPFVIEIQDIGENFTYSYNVNPSSTGSGNTVWAQKDDINDPKKLLDKLEELSCRSTGALILDIYKNTYRQYYCKTSVRPSIKKHDGDIYEFIQTPYGGIFDVQSIRYNGKGIEISIPKDGIKEISTFYWKHNFGKPLVVKVTKKNGEINYHFSHGRVGEQWDKRAVSVGVKLEDAVVEHNCTRNRTTTINLSEKVEPYCCTEKCMNKRIKVTSQQSDAFPGFTVYEHISKDGLPLIMGSIVSKNEKQRGIKYPIRYAYKVTVYYQNTCANEPIFMEILYMNDSGQRDYKWYKRVTPNGWDDLSNQIPDTDTEIYNSLRENFKTVADLLSNNSCDSSKLGVDNIKFSRTDPEPLNSPEETFSRLVNEANHGHTTFIKPIGPEDEAAKEKKIEEEKKKH